MSQRDRLLDQIRRVALQGMGERRTDGQLLEHFISERNEAAFALLLRRHGAMVWSVCRRVLGNAHDADDAFQAAFLVLVRKADSVRPREAVGNWLYGVAYRTALEARGRIARRRAKELSLHDVPPPQIKPEELGQELWPILDRELSRLAEKYRLPIVLCDLEGRSRKEVARQLAIPEGTLSSRLATARKKLAARLARLGFVVSCVSLTALLTDSTATAGMGPALFTSTTKAALLFAASPAAVAGIVSATVSTLTEGVIKTMFIAKIKTAALLLCGVAVLGAGSSGVYYQTRAGAADSPRDGQSDRRPSPETIARQSRNDDDWRRIAEELKKQLEAEREKSRDREHELRSLADKLRSETAVLQAEIKQMRFDAEARERKSREGQARQKRSQNTPAPNPALFKLDKEREVLVADFQARWNELQRQQKELVAKQKNLEEDLRNKIEALNTLGKEIRVKQEKIQDEARQKLAALDGEKAHLMREQAANQPNARGRQGGEGGDKLDQILDRLERLEKRLDRLEKGRP